MTRAVGALAVAVAVVVPGCRGRGQPHTRDDARPSARHAADDASRAAHDGGTDARDAAVRGPAPARDEHVVWRATDNRHSAERAIDGEPIFDAGDFGFVREVPFGPAAGRWKLGVVVDGDRAVVADAAGALSLPLTAREATATQLTLRVHAQHAVHLVAKLGGRPASDRVSDHGTALEAGWQTIAIAIAPGRFASGDNQLVLEASPRTELAIAWLRVGNEHPPGDADARAAATFEIAADTIALAEHATVAWNLEVPDGAELAAEVGAPCHVEVAARSSDDALVGGLLGADVGRISLARAAGKVVRLALTARDCPRATVAHARIALPGAALASPPSVPSPPPPHDVLVWTIAGLDPRVLDPIAPGAATPTPAFAELARASAVFRAMITQGEDDEWPLRYPAPLPQAGHGKPGSAALRPRSPFARVVRDAGFELVEVAGNRSPAQVVDEMLAELRKDPERHALIATTTATPEPCEHPARASSLAEHDAALATLVARLKAEDRWSHTMLVVRGTRDRCEPDRLHEAALRVPLLVHDPDRFAAGLVDDIVATIDVAPTIAVALGGALPEGAQGRALPRTAAARWPASAFAEVGDVWIAHVGRWKGQIARVGGPITVMDATRGVNATGDAHEVERRVVRDALAAWRVVRAQWTAATWGSVTDPTQAGAAALDAWPPPSR